MTRFLLLVTMGVSLAAAAGCGAGTHHSAIHSGTAVSQANDPSWCPPGEEFSVGDGRAAQLKREQASTQMKPNAAQRPTRGAVRAAIY